MQVTFVAALGLAIATQAQEIYLTTTGYTARPHCTKSATSPSYHFKTFSYSLSETVRYATSVPSPTTTKTYAPVYKDAAKHLKSSVSTTTWGDWLPGETVISATDSKDPYGQAAWSSMWLDADLHNYVSCSKLFPLIQQVLINSRRLRPASFRLPSVLLQFQVVSWSCRLVTILGPRTVTAFPTTSFSA